MSTTTETKKQINRLNIGVETDRFKVIEFDHLEFYSMDAKSTMKALKVGAGMEIVGHSAHETGNHEYASFVLKTGTFQWVVTAPYLSEFQHPDNRVPHPKFDAERVKNWVGKHGTGVAVIGIKVENATEAYEKSTGKGEADSTGWAKGVTEPTEIKDENGGSVMIAEIYVYGETIVRFVEHRGFKGVFLPGYKALKDPQPLDYGLRRMDHVVGNVHNLQEGVDNIKKWFGFHEFAAFTKEDIQTEWTSLNSTVMSNNANTVLLPLNEPAKKKRESQITEYLKANNGPGVQHLAIFAKDVFKTVETMGTMSQLGGFEFIPTPKEYYEDELVKKLMKEHLTEESQKYLQECGILIDRDDEGVLLQIFTRPLFDRPTLFIEVIQRLCHGEVVEKPGCGGFGKGNFRALFQSIERLQALRGMLLEEKE